MGAGPSGFYAAESLLRSGSDIAVYMFEKLPVPFGLVRYGVAPDHPKLKSVAAVFGRIAQMDGFRFVGNVEVGRDVSVADLQSYFNATVFAYGAERGRRLGIPGESMPGSLSAHEFVAWYNGHPEFRDLRVDLDTEDAVVVGHGNVALDVARILAKPVDALRRTDIADHALQVLAESRLKTIHIVGRRGPAQVRFVSKELREFLDPRGFVTIVDPQELTLGTTCKRELADPSLADTRTSLEMLRGLAANSDEVPAVPRTCRFRFRCAPAAISGRDRVQSLQLHRTRLVGETFQQTTEVTGEVETIPCGLIVGSVGYWAKAIESLPLNNRSDRLENAAGRIVRNGTVLPGLYVTGWAKRGPRGTIGTNRNDSVETVAALLADRPALNGRRRESEELIGHLRNRGIRPVTYAQWQKLDRLEVERGEKECRPRVKLTKIDAMLTACRASL